MNGWSDRERTLARYLLGDLAAADAEHLEQALFTDDSLHEELLATGDDLIHAYLAGALTAEDRQRFEGHFLATARRRQRFALVRDLVTAAGRVEAADAQGARAARMRWPVWTAAAAVLAALVAGAAWWRQPRPARGREQAGASVPAVSMPGPSPSAAASDSPREQPEGVRTVRLGSRPGPQPTEIALSAKTKDVRVEVPVADETSPTFSAAVRSPDGHERWRTDGLVPAAPEAPLRFTIPAAVIAGGDYLLVVEGEATRERPAPRPRQQKYLLRVVRSR